MVKGKNRFRDYFSQQKEAKKGEKNYSKKTLTSEAQRCIHAKLEEDFRRNFPHRATKRSKITVVIWRKRIFQRLPYKAFSLLI